MLIWKSLFCYEHLIHRKRSPFPAGEGSRKSRFLAIDGCTAVTDTTSGRRGRRPLPERYKSLFRRWTNVQFATATSSDDRWSPLQTKQKPLLLATDQTKIFISLFTIKIATRGSVLSTGCFIAIELNKRSRMSLWFTIAQSTLGNIGSSYIQTL